MSQSNRPLLSLKGISKAYAGVVANNDISLDLNSGEIHALLGENGAGKSTLVKIMYGLVKPDRGTMLIDGEPYQPSKPSAARNTGLAMVFQHFTLFEAMTVAENIAVGMEKPPPMATLVARISELSDSYGLPIQPKRQVAELSAGERQRVEIIRCLLQSPRLLIMDEPTSVLTPQEAEILFTTLRQLAAEGTAILYISHKLKEIKTLCHRASILRGGKLVGACDPAQETAQSMAQMMVGSELQLPKTRAPKVGPPLLVARSLCAAAATAFGTALTDISFVLQQGSILGIAGVAGNGQDELFAVLAGERLLDSHSLQYRGEDIGALPPNQRRKRGLLSGPEERLGHAAAPALSLADNTYLTARSRQQLTRWGFMQQGRAASFAEQIIATFDVRTAGSQAEAGSLSGGNLQKFVIGREVLQRPEVLVLNQPTWGVDAAAAAAIRQAIVALGEQGSAAIVISQDLDELLEISDQFAVLTAGRLSPVEPTATLTSEQIGMLMGGQLEPQDTHVTA